jgi:hypothetical protein
MKVATSITNLRILAALYLTIVYLNGILPKAAWLDDWGTLIDPSDHRTHAIRDGRIIYGWVIDVLYSLFGDLNSIFFIRIFGLIGIILTCDFVIKKFVTSEKFTSLYIATLFSFTIPAFQFAAHAATFFVLCWAAFLALQGYNFFSKKESKLKLVGIILGIISILSYPLMFFYVIPLTYILWFISEKNIRILLKQMTNLFSYMACCFILATICVKLYLMFNDLPLNERVDLVSLRELPVKLYWFLTRPMLLTFRPFLVDSPETLEAILVSSFFVLLLITLFYLKFRSIRVVILHILVFNLVAASSLAPLFVASQNEIELYFILSSSWLFIFLLIYLFLDLVSSATKFNPKIRFRIFGAVSSLLLFFGVFTVNDRFNNFLAPVEKSTISFLKSQLYNCTSAELSSGISILPRTKPWETYENLGVFSQSTDLQSSWVPISAVKVVLRDLDLGVNSNVSVKWESSNNADCKVNLDEFNRLK